MCTWWPNFIFVFVLCLPALVAFLPRGLILSNRFYHLSSGWGGGGAAMVDGSDLYVQTKGAFC